MWTPEEIRRDFPILEETVNGRPLVYLDNAATTQMPEPVLENMCDHYRHDHANVHRGIHTLSERSTDVLSRSLSAPSVRKRSFSPPAPRIPSISWRGASPSAC